MIASFRDTATEALFHGEKGKVLRRIPSEIRPVAVRKLDMLNADAENLERKTAAHLESGGYLVRGGH